MTVSEEGGVIPGSRRCVFFAPKISRGVNARHAQRGSAPPFLGARGLGAGGVAAEGETPFQAFQARSPLASFNRVGRPIRSRIAKKGAGSSSSTLAIRATSQVPSAISIAAATGGTPAV